MLNNLKGLALTALTFVHLTNLKSRAGNPSTELCGLFLDDFGEEGEVGFHRTLIDSGISQ